MEKRYQIFISSTYLDLIAERQKIANAISGAKHIPVGMELFPASTLHQWKAITQFIDTCDYYILIIGRKYGSVAPILEGELKRKISYTQKEYEYAYNKGIPILTFIKKQNNLANDNIENTWKNKKLYSFTKLVENNGYTFKYWENSEDLVLNVLQAINEEIKVKPRPGWIRDEGSIEFVSAGDLERIAKEKTIYYKFLHLTDKSKSAKPIYKRFVPRLDDFIDVYDEYITFVITKLFRKPKSYQSTNRTSGSVGEVISLFPFNLDISDTYKNAHRNPANFQPVIRNSSDVYITSSNYFNGFQKGNKDLGVRAEKDTSKIRIIADFASIPDFKNLVCQEPQVFHRKYEDDKPHTDKKIGIASVLAPGVYYAEADNIKADEDLRIEFDET